MAGYDDMLVTALNDCWRRIGVAGDGSCPELRTFVHCRNCPVHGAAALALLDRAAPAGYLAECSRQVALDRDSAGGERLSVVIFRIGSEWLALATAVFLEVAVLRAIHSLPSRRGGLVQGLANVRGELLVCVSLARLLDLPAVAPVSAGATAGQVKAVPRLVVIAVDGQRLGFAVDEMQGLQRVAPSSLQAVPATVARAKASYSKAVLTWQATGAGAARCIGLLDDQLLLRTLRRGLA